MSFAQASTLSLGRGHALTLASTGRLDVVAGRVWLTREQDLDDHWLEAGDAIELEAGQMAVIEASGGRPACLRWTPDGFASRLVQAAHVLFHKRPQRPAHGPHNPRHAPDGRIRPRAVAQPAGGGAPSAA